MVKSDKTPTQLVGRL